VLAVYVLIDASRTLLGREHPGESIIGIVVAAGSLLVMPLLARAKRRVAAQLTSSALTAEARQTEICTTCQRSSSVGCSSMRSSAGGGPIR
jgi:divalent metal cation (Fe/Co/Zn/Cd) transporter